MQTKQFFTKFYLTLSVSIFLVIQKSEQANRKAELVVIDEDNWSDILRGEWLVDFYAPWCPGCQRLKPEWDKLVEWSNDLNIRVASADVTKYPGLSGRFMVSGLPTIYHVKDGLFRIYNGPRDHSSLINFVEEQGWKAVEPVSRLWAPDSLHMSALACLFRVSMALRDVHSHLTDEYGLPYYVSYFLFALCTVIVGTVLGLLIVFVVDLFLPARYSGTAQEQERTDSSKKTKSSGQKKENDSDLEDTNVSNDTTTKQTETKQSGVRRRGN